MHSHSARVNLIGSYPPPYGGVSVHIQRLQELLLNSGIECTVIDFSSQTKNVKNVIDGRKIWKWGFISRGKGEITNVHFSGLNLKKIVGFFLLSLLGKMKRSNSIITYHSLRDSVGYTKWLKESIAKAFLKSFPHFIAVSPLIKSKLVSLAVESNRISVVPAFLPPRMKKLDVDEIPDQVWDFIRRHDPIISANANQIASYNDQDLYGVDMCVDLCADLRNTWPHVGFIFALSEVGNLQSLQKTKQMIAEKRLRDNFLLLLKPCQFYPILVKTDVFVRPSNTDGDSVSVREALYFKIPTVTSDIVPRPDGTVLFRNRDFSDFKLKVRDVLCDRAGHKTKLESIKVGDNSGEILRVYQKLDSSSNQFS